jgi:ribosome recycling factor
MANVALSLTDLILFSRSITLEEKQEILKNLNSYPEDKKKQLYEVFQEEFDKFQKLNDAALHTIQELTISLQKTTSSIPI